MPESRHRRSRGQALSRRARSAGTLANSRPRKKKTNKLYLAASLIIAILVIAGFAVGGLVGGGGGAQHTRTGDQSGYVEGIGVQQPIESSFHQTEGTTIEYASFPPTSGDHWPPGVTRRCGFYEEGMPDEVAVHHLEHRNIVVSYNLPDSAQVDRLKSVMGDISLSHTWGITRSYDKIPEGQVAVAAWGIIDTMEGVDGERISDFFEAYAGNIGPEVVPCR